MRQCRGLSHVQREVGLGNSEWFWLVEYLPHSSALPDLGPSFDYCWEWSTNKTYRSQHLPRGLRVCLALCIPLPLGFFLGLVPAVRGFLSPSLNFFQQVPAIAWIPMFILWLGIDEASKIAIIVYSAFFPIFLNTLHGIASTDPKLKEVAYTYGLSRWGLITRVYLPSAAPSVFVGMRLGLSYSWRSLVAAELLGASKGIGYLIQEGREMAQPDLMLVGVLVIGLTGLCLDFIFRHLEKRFLPWQARVDTHEVPRW